MSSDGRKNKSMIQTLSSGGVSKSSNKKEAAQELFVRKCAADPAFKETHFLKGGTIVKIKRRRCAYGERCTSAATRKCIFCNAPLCIRCARDTCVYLGGSETDNDFPIVCGKEGCQESAALSGLFEDDSSDDDE